MARRKEINYDRVLDAAEEVMVESGGRNFTLDAVAERAGISKGGLVYNFPTKDALIAAALERELTRFSAAWQARVTSGGLQSSNPLLAYIEEVEREDIAHLRTASLLMTALVNAPQAMESARAFYRSIFDNFDATTPRGRDVRQAVLAIEGLFFLQGLGLVEPDHAEWASVVDHALATLRN